MDHKQILQNVNAIAVSAQKAGLFTLEESAIILETLNALKEILKEDEECQE